MSVNSKSGVDKLNYEVDDKVSDQLGSLNKGFLAKPQFWVIVMIIALVAFLIYRRQQIKKEQQNHEVGESENLNEDVEAGNYPKQEQLQQVETGSVGSAAGDERVVEETENKE